MTKRIPVSICYDETYYDENGNGTDKAKYICDSFNCPFYNRSDEYKCNLFNYDLSRIYGHTFCCYPCVQMIERMTGSDE